MPDQGVPGIEDQGASVIDQGDFCIDAHGVAPIDQGAIVIEDQGLPVIDQGAVAIEDQLSAPIGQPPDGGVGQDPLLLPLSPERFW